MKKNCRFPILNLANSRAAFYPQALVQADAVDEGCLEGGAQQDFSKTSLSCWEEANKQTSLKYNMPRFPASQSCGWSLCKALYGVFCTPDNASSHWSWSMLIKVP